MSDTEDTIYDQATEPDREPIPGLGDMPGEDDNDGAETEDDEDDEPEDQVAP